MHSTRTRINTSHLRPANVGRRRASRHNAGTQAADRTMRNCPLLAVLCVVLNFGACSTEQAYGVGQAWQRNECFKINDAQERGRCLASTGASYEDYKRQSEAVKGTKQVN